MSYLVKLAVIFIGSLLISTGINGFLIPHHLLDGGLEGISLTLHYFYNFPAGLSMLILSLPLCIYCWFRERNYFIGSILGLLVSAFFIDWLAPLRNKIILPIELSSIIGGSIIGTGTGLMLRFETSTGGTDLLAHVISKKFSLNIGWIIFLLDGLIVVVGFKEFGAQSVFFSALTIFTVGVVTSFFVQNHYRGYGYWR